MPDGPLAGITVGVTGARKGAELCGALERRGAVAVHGPTIEPDQPTPDAEVLPTLRAVLDDGTDWFVANTGTGVRLLDALASRHGLRDRWRGLLADDRVCVVARGAKAVGGLAGIGVRPAFVAPDETDASVAEHLSATLAAGDRVTVQFSARTGSHYATVCAARSAAMTVLRPYRSGVPTDDTAARDLVERTIAHEVDVVISTSAIATDNLLRIAERHGLRDDLVRALRGDVVAAAIGTVTADAFLAAGIEPGIVPDRHRTGALLGAIEAWAAAR